MVAPEPQSYSYKVEDEAGNLLVDQVEQNVPAENVYGVVICSESGIDEEYRTEWRFVSFRTRLRDP